MPPLHSLLLPNDQKLTWREAGDPGGKPVFFFHGWPAEAHQVGILHEAATARGLRIIGPNRPGIGGSSRQPERGLLDWPPLVIALADHLGLGKFGIVGLSGGGPYTQACAWALPGRVTRAAVVCGAPPAAPGPDRVRFSPVYRLMLWIHDHFPALLRGMLVPVTLIGAIPPPWLVFRTLLLALGPADRAVLGVRENFRRFYPGFQNAMTSGAAAIFDDGHPYASAWPFEVSEIRVPMAFWHGRQDQNFHWTLAQHLAARIPGTPFHLSDDGHYSLLSTEREAILDWIAA